MSSSYTVWTQWLKPLGKEKPTRYTDLPEEKAETKARSLRGFFFKKYGDGTVRVFTRPDAALPQPSLFQEEIC